jgi:integrase
MIVRKLGALMPATVLAGRTQANPGHQDRRRGPRRRAQPGLVEELIAHLDRLRRAGQPTDPESFLLPHVRGDRMARQRVLRIVSKAAARAGEQLVARGLPPLPNTTPHSLRRTYVSIALLANNFDVLFTGTPFEYPNVAGQRLFGALTLSQRGRLPDAERD